jgi:Ca2+-binding RTX toxin-like protein
MATTKTAFQQLYVELINQARTDPRGAFDRAVAADAADPNIANNMAFFGVDLTALSQQFDALTAVAPVAWNGSLEAHATAHSRQMIQFDAQEHFLPNESGLLACVQAQGDANTQSVDENIFTFERDPVFGHTAFFVDWGFDDVGFDGNGTLRPNFGVLGDGIQEGAGHRTAFMSAGFQEVGVAGIVESDANTNVGDVVTTQHFGARFDYEAQFLGVVFDDQDSDAFCYIGEGLEGVTISIAGVAGYFQTLSSASGGWQFEAPAGDCTITFSGTGLSSPIVKTATLGPANVKIDARADEAAALNAILGSPAENNLQGSINGDRIEGLAGDDLLDGLKGDDVLIGGYGADRLYGSDGADELDGGAGIDILCGGDGNDAYFIDDVGDQVIETATGGSDRVRTGLLDVTLPDQVERLDFSGFGANNGAGNSQNNIINGTAAANQLDGLNGNDLLQARAGYDALTGGAGNDRLLGQGGSDILAGGDGTDLLGGGGDDEMTGGASRDRLIGQGGDDVMNGGDGNDLLVGSTGVDVLVGDAGSGRLLGNAGADRYVYENISDIGVGFAGQDRIFGFSSADGDKINLSGIDANATTASDDDFQFVAEFTNSSGQALIEARGAAFIVALNVTGDGLRDGEIFCPNREPGCSRLSHLNCFQEVNLA